MFERLVVTKIIPQRAIELGDCLEQPIMRGPSS